MFVKVGGRCHVRPRRVRVAVVYLDTYTDPVVVPQHLYRARRVQDRVRHQLAHQQLERIDPMRDVPSEAPLGDRVARVGDNARARRQCEVFVAVRDVRLCVNATGCR